MLERELVRVTPDTVQKCLVHDHVYAKDARN